MNKKLLSLLAILLLISNINAANVDEATAQTVGRNFAQHHFNYAPKTEEGSLVKATDTYFVYNFGTSGFVIVSADDTFRPIIGYSDEGCFPTENASPEMMYYLDNLSQGRQAALRAKATADAQTAEEWNCLRHGQALSPRNGNRGKFYLVPLRWNQNNPYNKFAPSNSYAGCVATAMSMVMAYWQYPSHGYGSHSYTHYQYGVLSADFSAATYDYSLMPISISESSPVECIDAVAGFMYHCGIAVDMDFSPSGSGAFSQDVPEAVLKYFGYSNRCRMYQRDDMELGQFQRLLREQFDLGWPCYYSGTDTEGNGGHAFVCDGYDDTDLFHFNWGWGGSGNGFFAIDELNVSSYMFNSGQAVVANYVPSDVFEKTAKAPDFFQATPNGDDEFTVSLSWTNPTATVDGRPLEAIDQMVLMRDGAVVRTFDNPNPGETMAYVDSAGLPIQVNYTLHALCQGCGGRKAHADGIKLGPTCLWTIDMIDDNLPDWTDGNLTLLNASGLVVGSFSAERDVPYYDVEVPLGRVSLVWTAPSEPKEIKIEILDNEANLLFSFYGNSDDMPVGTFFETVNTCGGQGRFDHPSNLKTTVEGEDVTLQWTGIDDPGYGYIIYRDGLFYNMVANVTTFTDALAAPTMHSYCVTAFCLEGETDPSNTVCTVMPSEAMAPTDFDYEILANGRAKLSWNAPDDDTDLVGYRVYRRTTGEDFTLTKTLAASATSYTESGNPVYGERRYYNVVAVYNNGTVESNPAPWVRDTDLLYVEINRTIIPSDLQLEAQDGNILLQWSSALYAESYNVYCNDSLVAEGLEGTQFSEPIHDNALVYQVKGVRNGVESSPSNKACYGNVTVDESTVTTLRLFPNPTSGRVTVQTADLQEIRLYNATGQQLLRMDAQGPAADLDLSGLSKGVYFIRVRTGQGTSLQKVVLM